ncbi:MAG: DegV family protein [Peptococcia bacterium]
MSDYVIVTDSTSDLSPEMIKQHQIEVIPMEVIQGDHVFQHYPDARNLSFQEFYNRVRKGEGAKTSQINTQTYLEVFGSILEQGKNILYIAFSSGLSGSYQNSLSAVQELKNKYSDRKIIVVDSLSASGGEGYLVYHTALQKAQEKTIEEAAAWAEEHKLLINHLFVVDDLHHLQRGGRISHTAAIAGSILSIKPLLNFDNEGKMAVRDKIRTRRKSLKELVNRMQQNYKPLQPKEEDVIFISHGDCAEDAQYVADLVKETFKVKEVVITYIGPVIGAHSGPNTVALFYFGDSR